jgi:hypothetical protein
MERWGFSIRELEQGATTQRQTAELTDEIASETRLRRRIPWPSSMSFEGLSDSWRTVYGVNGDAVVVERDLGRGSIVLCADSYLFSNEALRKEPQAAFLLWAAGEGRQIVFDETHLGVEEQAGVAVLARRYRLHGLMIGLGVLAAMWVWRATLPLVPASANEEPERRGEVMMGRDAASGLSALLRRHVSSADLLGACLGEWRRSFPAEVRRLGGRADELKTVVVRERNLRPGERQARQVMAYCELRELIEPRKPRRQSEAKHRLSKDL